MREMLLSKLCILSEMDFFQTCHWQTEVKESKKRVCGVLEVEAGYWQVQSSLWKEIRESLFLWALLASPTAPAVITNPDLSNAQPSREGYVSLTIQSLAREAQVSQTWRCCQNWFFHHRLCLFHCTEISPSEFLLAYNVWFVSGTPHSASLRSSIITW